MAMRLVALLVLAGFLTGVLSNPAVHSHDHKHSTHEREKDGSHKAMDHDHYKDGEHNVEFDHESILGSRETAEEFDNLPPAEAKYRLGLLVKKMDSNEDGFVNNDELVSWIRKSFENLTTNDARERMDEVDTNKDGFVTWTEHYTNTYADDEGNVQREADLEDEEKRYLKEEEDMFQEADSNRDLKLSFEEYKRFASPDSDPDMVKISVRHEIADKDKNGDGKIDFSEYLSIEGEDEDAADSREEFENIISGGPSNKEERLAQRTAFVEYDKDGDDLLNIEEVAAWLYPSSETTAKEEADHLISEADGNNDKKLSYKEVVDNHELFVGSEATMYGDSLRHTDEL